MNYIAFALFGDDPKYRRGMLENVRTASTFFPGWQLLIYCDRINHDALILEMRQEGLGADVECILHKDRSEGVEGASWRFHAVLRPDADVVMLRDADSVFTHRERTAVNEWLSSKLDTHVIRDHPHHKSHVMAGLLGVRGEARKELARLVQKRMNLYRMTEYGSDQLLLNLDFYPKVVRKTLVHTNCVRYFPEYTRPLPPDRAGDHFIGAYAFQTKAELDTYEAIRRDESPVTLLPKHWSRVILLRKFYRKHPSVPRIKHGCRWCL
jgi:hypothetical protein